MSNKERYVDFLNSFQGDIYARAYETDENNKKEVQRQEEISFIDVDSLLSQAQ